MDYSKMDQMEQALFEKHDTEALTYLIEQGRELELAVDGHICFLSKYGTGAGFSLWVDRKEQSFCSMAELFAKSKIGSRDFLSVWEQSVLITLF